MLQNSLISRALWLPQVWNYKVQSVFQGFSFGWIRGIVCSPSPFVFGRFFSINVQNPSVSKSNWLHVVIDLSVPLWWVWCVFYKFLLRWCAISKSLQLPPVNSQTFFCFFFLAQIEKFNGKKGTKTQPPREKNSMARKEPMQPEGKWDKSFLKLEFFIVKEWSILPIHQYKSLHLFLFLFFFLLSFLCTEFVAHLCVVVATM